MYKVSVWLKGGGKIVEECEIDDDEALRIINEAKCVLNDGKVYRYLEIFKDQEDPLPIIVAYSEIAGVQVEKVTYSTSSGYHPRKLETRN